MTLFTATVSAGGDLAEGRFVVVDGHGSLVGAHIIPDECEDMAEAIAGFEELSRRPLLARRHDYGGEIPASVAVADIRHDAGTARKSLITFTPGKGCTPKKLGVFLDDCKNNGLIVDVALWPEMHRFMPPIQYRILCELYVPVIHEYGYTHTFTVTNYAAVTKAACARYWPGDDLADSVGVVFYPSGLSLNVVAEFADSRNVPLGLAEFGVALEHQELQYGISFLDYIQDFFGYRISQGMPCGDLLWLSGVREGDYRLTQAWELVTMWRHMFDTLTT